MAIEGIIDTSFTINIIQSNIPTDLKSKGIAKLGQIISDQSNKIPTLILPLANAGLSMLAKSTLLEPPAPAPCI